MRTIGKRNPWRLRLITVGVGLALLLGLFLARIQPLLARLSESKAESVTLKIIHEHVNDFLKTQDVSYDSLVKIGYHDQGSIAYVGTDMVKLNRFKSQIASNIQECFDTYDFGTIALPIGTVMGGNYFVGRGPSLRFHVDMSCTVECSFENVFDDAGINQTRHQIMLNVKVTTFAIARFCKTSSTVTTNFMIAETVIVGTVPEYYTQVEDSEDILEDLNNYGIDPR